jgi:hypothetical protein
MRHYMAMSSQPAAVVLRLVIIRETNALKQQVEQNGVKMVITRRKRTWTCDTAWLATDGMT